MASESTINDVYERALWDPNPTDTDLRARQLAVALGYPTGWRVVRAIETHDGSLDDGASARPQKKRKLIVDRIYSGDPETGCDMWYHHAVARAVAQDWIQRAEEIDQGAEPPTPYCHGGGHLLPRQAKFEVGQKVSVNYKGKWFEAKILRRKVHHLDGFRYQVYYKADGSKQSGIAEAHIRLPMAEDARQLAATLGFDTSWSAYLVGKNRYKIVSPDGTVYKSKKTALDAFESNGGGNEELEEEGGSLVPINGKNAAENDPPWRTSGHEYLGQKVQWKTEHKVTSRRTITVEQIGIVEGWISATDVDKQGQAGYKSEKTGQPAALFHVTFSDEPSLHPYGSVLIEFIDLEEDELKPLIEAVL